MTAEEFIIKELEHERSVRKETEERLFKALGEKAFYKTLLTQICKNIEVKESEWMGKYLDFDYSVKDKGKNKELFDAVIDFMKENGIIKDEEQEESENES